MDRRDCCASLHGLDARQEQTQAGGKRIDIEVRIGPLKIALEAEQGQSAAKRREAISDADKRLKQRNADCAIAVCYPEGITGEEQIPDVRMLWTIRAPNGLVEPEKARWTEANLGELASVVKLAPMQLGESGPGGGWVVSESGQGSWASERKPEARDSAGAGLAPKQEGKSSGRAVRQPMESRRETCHAGDSYRDNVPFAPG